MQYYDIKDPEVRAKQISSQQTAHRRRNIRYFDKQRSLKAAYSNNNSLGNVSPMLGQSPKSGLI